MATILQNYSAVEAVPIADVIADGAQAKITTTIDNSTNKHLGIDLETTITATGTFTGTFDIYMERSGDDTTFSYGAYGVNANRLFLGSITHVTTVATSKVIRVEQLPQFYDIVIENNSGISSTTIAMNIFGTN